MKGSEVLLEEGVLIWIVVEPVDLFPAGGLNNLAENSHQPIRKRERIMKRFKSARHLQRFVSVHDPIANLFHIPRHHIPSHHYRELREATMQMWSEIAYLQVA
jgi:putative transposase